MILARKLDRRSSDRRNARRGFTLMEVLLVIGILVALVAIALPNLLVAKDEADRRTAKLQVNNLAGSAELYNTLYSKFPSQSQGLNSLYTQPGDAPPNWKPVLKAPVGKDPWGNDYNYTYPGQKITTGGPDVWSNGPDGQSGTADDIGNWPSESK